MDHEHARPAPAAGPTLGFIGLGKMGGPLATRLIEAGHDVTVWDIDPATLETPARLGARVAHTPREVADAAEAVVLCLPSLTDIRDVTLGADGVCHGRAVRIVADCSTTGPAFARELADDLAAHGITLVDAPVSGGVKSAVEGRISIIMSGDQEAYDRIAPALAACGHPYHLGNEPGQGQMMKLVNNLLSQIGSAATYEAFVLGAKAGLDPDTMLDVINHSTGVNDCTMNKMPRSVLPRTFDYGASMETTYKDISLCMQEADRLGVTMFLGTTARQLWGFGVNHGGATRDSSTLITHLEQWAGVTVAGKAARDAGRA